MRLCYTNDTLPIISLSLLMLVRILWFLTGRHLEFCGVIVKDPYQSIAIPFSCYVYLSVLGIPLNLLGYTNIIPNIYFKSRDVEWFPCATSLIRKRGLPNIRPQRDSFCRVLKKICILSFPDRQSGMISFCQIEKERSSWSFTHWIRQWLR